MSDPLLIGLIGLLLGGLGAYLACNIWQVSPLRQKLAKANVCFRRAESTLELIEEVAEVGTWDVNCDTQELSWSDRVFELSARPLHKGPPSLEEAINYYHPDDRQIVQECVDRAMTNGEDYEFRVRLVDENGKVRPVLARALARFGRDGRVAGFFGMYQELPDTDDFTPSASFNLS